MKKTLIIFFASLGIIFSSCKFGMFPLAFTDQNVEDRVHSITRLDDSHLPSGTNGLSKYSFLIVTDLHIGADRYTHDDEAFFRWFENQLNSDDASRRPQFIINLGDSSDSGREAEFKEYVEWTKKVKELARNGKDRINDFKIYSVIGNHDIYNNGQDYYLTYMYPHFYSYCFDFANDPSTQGFEFFFLDSANGSLGRHQLNDLERKLKANSKPKIILTHCPVYSDGVLLVSFHDSLECAKILTLVAENNAKLMLEGHAHRNSSYDYGSMYEEVTSSYANNNTINLITIDETTGTCSTDRMKF
ncbi:metallophosphoesterase [Treponema sp.]|uniref:metallophosphoesterase family protein n=1 Tax=Treponema sp. TaxID=166 RepID=UPI00298E39F1|nr:metallophosphoesterase [Treponema sp.]MCQ2241126.1 metallophosphoesterase [Treponema sp.]